MAEVQYPSNSNKSKQDNKLKGSTTGDVGIKPSNRQKLLELMFAKDIKGALANFFWTRFMPSVKVTILNGIHGVINSAANWMDNTNGQTNYNAVSTNTTFPGQYINCNSTGTNYQQITETSGFPKASDLKFSLEEDANNALLYLRKSIEECGYVTVNNFYGWMNRKCDFTWNSYGWINLDNARVLPNNDGTWTLKLPKAVPLDKN